MMSGTAASPTDAAHAEAALEQPASERKIFDLHAAGLLSNAARDYAIAALRPSHHWREWANRTLLFLGAALLLAGIVFFFAYNWARMSSVARFGAVEVGLWICAIGAIRKGLDNLGGKVLLLAACVFVGVLMAVYGQVYQTGADAWQNYALWALLILPWVAIGRFGALWVLWLAVADTALILFWFQVVPPEGFGFDYGLFLLLAVLNGAVLLGYEFGIARDWEWLQEKWIRRLVWLSVLMWLTIPTVFFIVELRFRDGSLVGAIALAAVLPAGYFYFRHRAADLPCLALAVMTACVVVLTLVGKGVFEVSEDAPAFLLFGLIVLGVSSAAALYLRGLAKAIDRERNL
jgi:uncharacterized membrane protein